MIGCCEPREIMLYGCFFIILSFIRLSLISVSTDINERLDIRACPVVNKVITKAF